MYEAHSGGRIQLFVDRLGLHASGGNGWVVSVEMVDADSGTPAPGFDVIAEGTGDGGHSAGPVTLTDQGSGQYSGLLKAAPGTWDLAIRAETVPGGPAGVPLRKMYEVALEPGRDVTIDAHPPGGSGLGVMLPVASAVVTAAIIGWFFVRRRRRRSLVPVRPPA
jgi:hypothetical protein